jgi:hypothetical protein
MTAVAPGFAYATRYEAVVASVAVLGVVAVAGACRGSGSGRQRIVPAFAEVVVAGLPFAFSFVSWAAASLVITGHPFEQFSSVYGNAAQVALGEGGGFPHGLGPAAAFAAKQILFLEPLLIVALLLGLLACWRGRWALPLAATTILGSTLAFEVAAFATGQIPGWLRYQITAIPLALLLAGSALAERSSPPETPRRRPRPARPRFPPWTTALITAMGVLAVGLAGITRGLSLPTSGELAREEAYLLAPIFAPGRLKGQNARASRRFETDRLIAQYLDGLHLKPGAVLVDAAQGFAIILNSRRPAQFVTTPDRDFEPSLADPVGFGVEYMLTEPSAGYGSSDALNRAYPSIYRDGAGFGRLVESFTNVGDSADWRLYRVTPKL